MDQIFTALSSGGVLVLISNAILIDSDGFAHRNAKIHKIADKTTQAQHRQPRQTTDEKTDANQ